MMKTRFRGSTLLAGGMVFMAAAGAAFARPDTRAMNCAEAQAVVERNGAIVLSTGQHTYDRFLAAGVRCPLPDVPRLTYVPTRDEAQCPIGYTCRQNTDDDGGLFIR